MHIILEGEIYDNLDEIIRYRYRDSQKGNEFIFSLITYIYTLSIFPEMGRVIVQKYNIRKLIYQKYTILYQINYFTNLIRIIKIIQPKQDIDLILKNIQKYL